MQAPPPSPAEPVRADFALRGSPEQGAMIVGRAPSGTQALTLDGAPVPLAADGGFTLTRDKTAYDANADLVSNKKRDTLRWRADIHTPGLPANVRRLGDLRLECEIRWAVEQDDLPFVRRNLFRLAGGPCHSSLIHVLYPVPRNLAAVQARSGARALEIRVTQDRQRYVPPLHDQSWEDDTLLTLTYADDGHLAEAAPAAPLKAAQHQ